MRKNGQQILFLKSIGTLEEVIDFCLNNGLEESDGEYLFYNWEANKKDGHWMRAGRRLRDWRMSVMAWKAAKWLPSQREKKSAVETGVTLAGLAAKYRKKP